MTNCPYEAGKTPCGELETLCTADKSSSLLREREKEKGKFSSCKTVKGEFGQATELVIKPSDPNSTVRLTSIHASYNVDGTNGLLQIFTGDKTEPIWGARTMGMHLTLNFTYPLVSVKGEKLVLQLANKAGVQGHLSATWVMEEE